MPTYEYACDACGASHEEFRRMSEPGPDACPACGEGARFRQVFGAPVLVQYGNPTTFGQQAEINARRAGKEQMARMAEAQSVGPWTGPTPPGAQPPPERKLTAGIEPADLSKIKDVHKYIVTGRKD